MKPHHRILGGCAAAFIFSAIALIVTGCTAGSLPRPTANLLTPAVPPPGAVLNQVPPARPSVVGGAQIYAVKCQACHGIAGRGDGPRAAAIATQGGVVANLVSSASSEQALPSDWFNVVTNGRIDKLMPPFAQSLTPQDRWDVLSYVWAMAVPSATLQTDATTYAAAIDDNRVPKLKLQLARVEMVDLAAFSVSYAYYVEHPLLSPAKPALPPSA